MKQLLQNVRNGESVIADVPVPQVRRGAALVQNAASLVSAGTERTVAEFAEKNLLGKARSRPDLVRQVIDKAQREGILPTIEAAFNRLDQPMVLGYSSAGTIIAVGEGLEGFHVGDRVACAGGGFAVHAEVVNVPQNLLTPLPDGVDFESGAFTTLGAIAMHGFRLAEPQLGDRVVVIGMGLLGLLTAQIARAAGCAVMGIDIDQARVDLATKLGIPAVLRPLAVESGAAFTRGKGFDAVLICADTHSNDPIELAPELARDRAHVISLGAVGMQFSRKPYFEKELLFQVSRSYGPGRYDPAYEERGQDYPIGYVRWTEGRNLQAFVDLVAGGKVDVQTLISHRIPITEAGRAYELIKGKTGEAFLGVVLTYPQNQPLSNRIQVNPPQESKIAAQNGVLRVGVLGAGNYAGAVFLPAIKKTGGVTLATIASASGLTAANAARRFSFESASSSEKEVLEDKNIQAVVILTRHNQHARQVISALENGKHVYCEKPLALNQAELDQIGAVLQKPGMPLLMVGFNRRFAPLSERLYDFFRQRSEPLVAHYRVNAGFLPSSHWLHDPNQGGGRIIGEGCHFVDYLSFLVGSPPVTVTAAALPDGGRYHQDNAVFTFRFGDGSLGTLSYLANGDKSFPKEQVEVFCGGRVGVLHDFRRLELIHDGKRSASQSLLQQDKGHRRSWQAFLNAIRNGGQPPIPYAHLAGVSRATFAAMQALSEGDGAAATKI